jgi:hypothetical protein
MIQNMIVKFSYSSALENASKRMSVSFRAKASVHTPDSRSKYESSPTELS